MKEQEILDLLSKSYRSLSKDYTENGEQELFVIHKFEELFKSKNYLEGKISNRIIGELVNLIAIALHSIYLSIGIVDCSIYSPLRWR